MFNKTQDKEKLRKLLEILEFREIDELINQPLEDLEEVFQYYTSTVKSMSRRNNQLSDELKESYDRKDMMEFAEYVARLYDLEGMSKWTEKGDDEKLNKTVSDILNEFEKEKELASKVKSSDVDGKDITEILFGR